MTKDEATEKMIRWHLKIDPKIQEIHRFFAENEDDPKEPVKLLEVSPNVDEIGEVDVYGFAGTTDIPYSLAISTITPNEMQKVREGVIPLPCGWNLETAQDWDLEAVKRRERQEKRRARAVSRAR